MLGHRRFGALGCVLVCTLAIGTACHDDGDEPAERSEGPPPGLRDVIVTGPIANATRPNAFAAPTVDLDEHGYVAEEFFYEGRATAYEPGAEGNGLRGWDPQRYGSLSHPGDDFSYDIFTRAALLVGPDRGTLRTDPMHGLAVERVLGTGASQSAFRLTSYLDGVQPLTGALDGALLLVNFGRATRFETPDGDAGTIEATFMGSTRIRDDLGVPVMLVTTETEAESLYPVRQPDSDTFRTWEIAGASHAGAAGGIDDIIATFTRDHLEIPAGAFGSSSGAVGIPASPNFLRWLPVTSAARHHLARWAAGEAAPPSQPLITFAGDPPQIRRDDHGNALGGIRLPELDVPIATYAGTAEGADVMSSLFGTMTPFTPSQLRTLYPSRDAYLSAYDEAVDRAVDAGYVLHRDAADIKRAVAATTTDLFPALAIQRPSPAVPAPRPVSIRRVLGRALAATRFAALGRHGGHRQQEVLYCSPAGSHRGGRFSMNAVIPSRGSSDSASEANMVW